MRHYATLFDSKYLPQGLALYESLKRHSSKPFTLYILAMDKECDKSLERFMLGNRAADIGLISLKTFEELSGMASSVSASRTWQEYCWTCASSFTHWLMDDCDWDEITYLDADTFFSSDPEQVFAEIGDKSIGIVPHRFPPHRKHMEANGIYNVSLVHFKGPVGLKCLENWARLCREKCSAKEGCGDQKYLDAFETDYPGEVCAIQNIGVGLAPWNLCQYKVTSENGRVFVDGQELCLYHYHEFVPWKRLTNYRLTDTEAKIIYKPYIQAVDAAQRKIEALGVTA